jgi:hypothetical protein
VTNFFLNRLRKHADDVERSWPNYMFGGHVRTSTLVLVIAFLAVWWVYDDHLQSTKSNSKTTQVPATEVVPPGFVPDPNYTWVPRSRVQEPPTTVTMTETPTTAPSPTPTTTTTAAPPPFNLPTIVLPPPFGSPATTTAPPPPAPAPPAAPPLPGLP